MSLNDFLARASAFFDKAEKTQDQVKELEQARGRITELEGQLAAANAGIQEKEARIVELTGQLEKAQGEVNAKGTEIAGLEAQLGQERQRVDETLAGLGVDPKRIPAAKPDAAPAAGASTGSKLLDQFNAIKDPAERTLFYRQHQKEIQGAWRPPAGK